jgi:hypothetical protein
MLDTIGRDAETSRFHGQHAALNGSAWRKSVAQYEKAKAALKSASTNTGG